jgi:DNA-binding winged helix-turn-helix (wHTH) protein
MDIMRAFFPSELLRNMSNKEWFLINDQICFYPQEQMLCSTDGNKKITLTRIVNKMLYYFCTHEKVLISYEEIMCFIWEERHKTIGYGSLYQALLVLRKSFLELEPDCRFIKTIRKSGIIFDCEIVENSNSVGVLGELAEKATVVADVNCFSKAALQKKKIIISMLLMVVVIAAAAAYFYSRFEGVFDLYTPAKLLAKGCSVRYNSDAYDTSQYNQFIEQYQDLCIPNSILYVTTYFSREDVSVVRCRNFYLHQKNIGNCTVFYFRKVKGGANV